MKVNLSASIQVLTLHNDDSPKTKVYWASNRRSRWVIFKRRHQTPRFLFMVLIFMTLGMMFIEWNTLQSFPITNNIEKVAVISEVEREQMRGTMDQIRQTIDEINDLLSNKAHPAYRTWPSADIDYSNETQVCQYFKKVNKAERVILNDIFNVTHRIQHTEVTIITQTSLNRFHRVKRMMESWGGPISIALHIHPEEVPKLEQNLINLVLEFPKPEFLALHIVIDFLWTEIYPINFLRNVAFNATVTERLFILDVDLVCSPDLYNILKNYDLGDKDAVVVPSFEIRKTTNAALVIRDRRFLLETWEKGIILPFRSWIFPAGGEATDYDKWKNAKEVYTVKYELGYEPFVLLKKTPSLPRYNEIFMNRFFDRSSHVHSLFLLRYNFIILPNMYVLHFPHKTTRRMFAKYFSCSYPDAMHIYHLGELSHPDLHENLVNRTRVISYE